MRGIQVTSFGNPADLSLVDMPQPEPADDEVVIDVCAAGVNFPDLLVTGGTYQHLPPLPFVPGKELAGVVTATGGAVHTVRIGSRVAVQVEHGAFAERVVARAANVVDVPDELDDVRAAAMGMGHLTAHFALLHRAGMIAGEHVLITGATGDVGSAAVQIVAASGAHAIAHVRTERHAARLLKLGAEHVVVGDPQSLRDHVRELTAGAGVDVVVETVGGETFRQALRCVTWEGRLVVVGFAGGEVPQILAGHVLVKNLAVIGLQFSDYRDREPQRVNRVQRELMQAVAAGKLQVPIAARLPLEAAADALESVRRGGKLGKVVLTIA